MLGEGGFDRLFGGAGDDNLQSGADDDAIFGEDGNDSLDGGEGDDRLNGGGGDDIVEGGDGNDELAGGAGFDTIHGGSGNDVLSGIFNADTFVFADGFGQDRITDFDAANQFEVIDLSGVASIVDYQDLYDNHMSEADDHLIIDTDAGDQLTIENVGMSEVSALDFLF